jgi:uncharacterized protein
VNVSFTMNQIPVTLLYGGLSGLLLTVLGINVSVTRGKHAASVENSVPPAMTRVHRAHGNAAEWIPAGIALLLLLELSGSSSLTLHLFGGAFVVARAFHGIGLIAAPKLAAGAAGLNYLLMLGMSLTAIVRHF